MKKVKIKTDLRRRTACDGAIENQRLFFIYRSQLPAKSLLKNGRVWLRNHWHLRHCWRTIFFHDFFHEQPFFSLVCFVKYVFFLKLHTDFFFWVRNTARKKVLHKNEHKKLHCLPSSLHCNSLHLDKQGTINYTKSSTILLEVLIWGKTILKYM